MSNQFQSISSGFAELKNYYQGPIVDQFNEDLPIYRGAEKIKNAYSGQQVVRPLRTSRNQGIGATSDGGTLPAIGRQTTQQAIVAAKYNYLRFGVTGPMIKASANDIGSFVRSAAYELKMGYGDLKKDVSRQLSWDGSGTLAKANANTAASTSLVIKGRETGEPALKYVDVNLVFDIVSGGAVIQSGITVNAVSGTPFASTATLTLSAPVTVTAGDALVRSGSYGYEIQGLLYSINGATSTIYNIDRSATLSYQSNEIDLNSAALSLDYLQQGWNAGRLRGNSKFSAIYSDFASQRMYQKLLTADKRYVNTVKGDGGFANKEQVYMDFNGLAWVADQDCPQRVFFLPEDVLKMYVLAEMEFADETGSMYIAQTSADSFETRIRMFANMFNEQPAGCAVLKNYISP